MTDWIPPILLAPAAILAFLGYMLHALTLSLIAYGLTAAAVAYMVRTRRR
jgi:hypothetical protein